jgi:hypothetical protein
LKAWGGRGKLRPFFFCSEIMGSQCVHFFACPKKRTKERAPRHLSRRGRDTRSLCPAWGTPRCCRGFANSASPQTVQIPFSAASPVLGCVPMGFFLSPPFVLPRLADGGGKRRGNCLRAKPEFFRVPPSARSKGSPQGQDWLGCLFLVSSFGHAKEEKGSR